LVSIRDKAWQTAITLTKEEEPDMSEENKKVAIAF